MGKVSANNADIAAVSAVVVAGGRGARMGRPKQLLPICGVPMLLHSVGVFKRLPFVKEVIVVASAEDAAKCGKELAGLGVKTVPGGATRLESVRNGVAAVSKDSAIIAVHDGARPLVSPSSIEQCVRHAAAHGAAVLAVPVKDTVKVAAAGVVARTLNRAELWAAQTPQCYRSAVLLEALSKFQDEKDATDESQLVERLGHKVYLVESDYFNIKVTSPEDLTIAEAFMSAKTKSADCAGLRVGMGYDIHRLVAGRPLIMGGVTIEHPKGLLGHSDGDVILHAVCDSALGAIAAGEIGVYFPPGNVTLMGISSRVIAEKTLDILKERKASIAQVDITVIAEEPKLLPYYQVIRESLAGILKLDMGNVSFKAKSSEGLGDIGKGDAIACHAVAMVRMN